MYWKSEPMFVCRLEDKDLPALGGPAEKVRPRGMGWGARRRCRPLQWPCESAASRSSPAALGRNHGCRRRCRPRWGPAGAGGTVETGSGR